MNLDFKNPWLLGGIAAVGLLVGFLLFRKPGETVTETVPQFLPVGVGGGSFDGGTDGSMVDPALFPQPVDQMSTLTQIDELEAKVEKLKNRRNYFKTMYENLKKSVSTGNTVSPGYVDSGSPGSGGSPGGPGGGGPGGPSGGGDGDGTGVA